MVGGEKPGGAATRMSVAPACGCVAAVQTFAHLMSGGYRQLSTPSVAASRTLRCPLSFL